MSNANKWMERFEKMVEYALLEGFEMIVCGDFNINLLNTNYSEIETWKQMICDQSI